MSANPVITAYWECNKLLERFHESIKQFDLFKCAAVAVVG